MSYTIVFRKGSSGGLGDRITGMINIKSFAKIFNKQFKAIWDIDLSKLFKDPNFLYNYENRHVGPLVDMLDKDNHRRFQHRLRMCKHCPFPNIDHVYFRSNMPTCQFLYMNPAFNLNYEKDMLEAYQSIYKDMFIPTNEFLEKVKPYEDLKIIGIQIRTGDLAFYSKNRKGNYEYNPIKDEDIETYLLDLYKKIDVQDRSIYITSDNVKTIEIAKKIFKDKNLLYNEASIVHIDISENVDTMEELFIDHYILSKFAEELYISDFSNFGKTIALCNQSNNIYNLKGIPVVKNKLVWQKAQTNGIRYLN